MAGHSSRDNSHEVFGPLTFEYNHSLSGVETKCLLCKETFDLSLTIRSFLKHLFETHNTVIDDVQNIEKLPQYILYWRNKFKTSPLEQVIPMLKEDCTGHKYYLLSDLLKEDKDLRHKLKLEHVLEVQEFERNDKSYARDCLLCRLEFKGSRHDFLQHLAKMHTVLLGDPRNMVYIEELVDKLDIKMKELKCFFCEKTFPDRTILKEHMRKKQHKQINPRNREYDKYFVVNYLESGKTWRDIEKEDDRFAVAPGKEEASNSDEEFAEWVGEDDLITCLFCQAKETNIYHLCFHMLEEHDFNFVEETAKLDFYQRVKLVNYVRKQVHTNMCPFCNWPCENPVSLQRHLRAEKHCKVTELKTYDQPEYFFPTFENDAFLYHIEDVDVDDSTLVLSWADTEHVEKS